MNARPALTVQQWLASVPAERKEAIDIVRGVVNKHLPKGYEETVDWGMLAWVVPLARLPNTYNGHPLMLAALGAHRKLMTIYLMTVYGDRELRREFEAAYKKSGKRLNMGGSCVHFKSLNDLPLDVVADTIARVGVAEYVERYEQSRAKLKPAAGTKKGSVGSKKSTAAKKTASVGATKSRRSTGKSTATREPTARKGRRAPAGSRSRGTKPKRSSLGR